MSKRRKFIKNMTIAATACVLSKTQAASGFTSSETLDNPKPGRDFFKELGVKSFINAGLPYSTLSGSLMWPEVVEAMNYASTRRARMKELHDAIGEKIASLIGCEAAMVSAGASSAMTLGTAACMTGTNEKMIQQLPDTNHSNQMREESRMTFQIPVDHILYRSGDLTISPLSLFPVRSGSC